ncbi:MAG: hypothetical protein AMJ79_08195 [Phycisphaerae bacterium SM23_30]|nr:MAG: hypothetical protein AMJ79_08195 [Phycisphaerae bacterium SM23_30]
MFCRVVNRLVGPADLIELVDKLPVDLVVTLDRVGRLIDELLCACCWAELIELARFNSADVVVDRLELEETELDKPLILEPVVPALLARVLLAPTVRRDEVVDRAALCTAKRRA